MFVYDNVRLHLETCSRFGYRMFAYISISHEPHVWKRPCAYIIKHIQCVPKSEHSLKLRHIKIIFSNHFVNLHNTVLWDNKLFSRHLQKTCVSHMRSRNHSSVGSGCSGSCYCLAYINSHTLQSSVILLGQLRPDWSNDRPTLRQDRVLIDDVNPAGRAAGCRILRSRVDWGRGYLATLPAWRNRVYFERKNTVSHAAET